MNKISFSIAIRNHNYGLFLEQCIESCLQQDYDPDLFEIIVVDDGSTDNCREILEKYQNKITVILQENTGMASAARKGILTAKNDFICLLDSDDYFLPNKLSKVAERINLYAQPIDNFILCHDLHILDDKNKTFLNRTWLQDLGIDTQLENMPLENINHVYPFAIPCGQICSTKMLQRIVESIHCDEWKRSVDSPLAFGSLLMAGSIHYMPEILGVYRIHENNYSVTIKNNSNGEFVLYRNPSSLSFTFPKLLAFLDNFIDTLDLDFKQRNERIAFLKRLEKLSKTNSKKHKFVEPKISFIITNFNYGRFLSQAIDSVINQNHQNIELIIVDDCSTDNSKQIIQEYQQKIPSLIFIQNEKNLGQLGSIAKGYSRITGTYFVLLDADDILDSHFAERLLFTHQYSSICMLVSSDIRFINENNELIHSACYSSAGAWTKPLEYFPPFSVNFTQWIFSPCSSNMFRKTKMFDLFFEELDENTINTFKRIGDWLILYYANILGGSTRLNECLVSFRMHGNNGNTQLHFPTPLINTLSKEKPNNEMGILFLFKILCKKYDLFKQHYSQTGLKTFIKWLLDSSNNPNMQKILSSQALSYNANLEIIKALSDFKSNIDIPSLIKNNLALK